ncbi:DmX-like protein 1 [Blomia tropicalis]|nr:DmX-like protein 1 [Blomia tropicalis]
MFCADLSGGQDGSVNLWEWNHQTPISAPRAAGTFAKVTRVQFNQQGNKFGVADTDGNLSLWQVSATHNKPFFCMISSFACHENGASSIMYAPLNQLLLTGGKKGEIFIFDMRQRTQRDRFQAHEGAVKCIALDPGEEFFATGSSDGDIKVWSLIGPTRTLMFSFMQEHSRSTFFRNMGMGVSHLYIDHCGRLFSCGADGSLKMRHLPTVECQPKWFFSPTSSSTQSALYGFENDTTGVNGIVNTI